MNRRRKRQRERERERERSTNECAALSICQFETVFCRRLRIIYRWSASWHWFPFVTLSFVLAQKRISRRQIFRYLLPTRSVFSTLFSTLYSPFLQLSKFPWNFTNNTNLWSTALVILGYTIGQISISKKKFRGENFGIKFHGTFDRLTSILFLSRWRKFEVEERVYEVEGDGQRSVTRSGSRVIDGQEGSSLGGSRSFLFVKGPTSILSISSASRKIPHSRRGERLPRD